MKKMPLEKAFTLIEPGPVTLISTSDKGKHNIMTLTWITVMDFTPRFALVTGPWNYSFNALMKNKECVIGIPGAEIAKKAVQVGSSSGKNTNKFKKFGFTPVPAEAVKAPLIKECMANIECKVVDYVKKHDIIILDGINAWIDSGFKNKKMFHAQGDGTFKVDGKKLNYRKIMMSKLPEGV